MHGKRRRVGRSLLSQRGLKRHNAPETFEAVEKEKQNRNIDETSACTSSPSSSGDLPEEECSLAASNGAELYNSLLMRLQSSNASLAHAYRKRKRGEEGKSDSEEEDNDSGSLSMPDDENAAEDGTDNESPRGDGMESKVQVTSTVGIVDGNDYTESEDDQYASDIDQEHNSDVIAHSASVASTSMSPFDIHLGYKFSDGEADRLSKRKWKYTWDVPAFDMLNCKWVGTGDCLIKDSSINPDNVLKSKLYKHWLDVYKKSGGDDFHSSRQRYFFSLCKPHSGRLCGHSNVLIY
uniref:U3 small nucleolar RNA-associated protein 25 isoform X1 n=1 Tax=Rhizophora mucronata TaxID=61149 RepID=A0A2P2MEH9_RHIMU